LVSLTPFQKHVLIISSAALGGTAIAYAITKISGYRTPLCTGNCSTPAECPAGCTCQYGVCVSPSRQCNTNQDCGFPDSGEKCVNGQCVSCGTMNCPCGTSCYPSESACCVCSNLVPNQIIAPPSDVEYMTWLVELGCLSGSVCLEAYPGNPNQCPCPPSKYPPACSSNNPNYQTFQLSGTVVDSAGAPICNQVVNLSASPSTINWNSTDGCVSGTFTISLPSSVTTDQNGNFQFTVQVTISFSSGNMLCCANPFCNFGYAGYTTTINYVLQENNTIRASTIVSLEMLICDYFNPLG
jgi:hypothetical protein